MTKTDQLPPQDAPRTAGQRDSQQQPPARWERGGFIDHGGQS
jgi:hypothetical protein